MNIKFRKPEVNDGESIYFLVESSPPLEINSVYSYMLVCSHFDQTSAICEFNNEIVGFTSGYIHPHQKDTLFIWQVAVKDSMRGRGIGKKMLLDILERRELQDIKHLETTVTLDNDPSRHMFTSLASQLDAPIMEENYFTPEIFQESGHPEEFMIRIGPL